MKSTEGLRKTYPGVSIWYRPALLVKGKGRGRKTGGEERGGGRKDGRKKERKRKRTERERRRGVGEGEENGGREKR